MCNARAAITNLFLVVKHPMSGPIHCRRPVLVRTQIPALGGAAQQADAPFLPRIAIHGGVHDPSTYGTIHLIAKIAHLRLLLLFLF